MKYDNNYSFQVSVSKDRYVNKEISGAMIGTAKDTNNKQIRKKYGYKSNVGIGYIASEETPQTLLDKLLNGAVMCNLFNAVHFRKDGTFSSSEKKDTNFKGSYTIGVDIDHTSFSSITDYISTLTYKPTFYYTSYSNEQPNKGIRFRMIYVFDEMLENKYFFRYAAYTIHKQIEKDTREEIDDYCGIRCSQYFNGTNINTQGLIVKYDITNAIYSLDDFNITKEGYIDFLKNNAYYKTNDRNRTKYFQSVINEYNKSANITEDITFTISCTEPQMEVKPSQHLISDMQRLDYDEFMKYNRHNYHYFYRVEKEEWINNSYQFIDDNYFALYYNVNHIKDGNQRRKKLYQRMCLRRIINPNVDADTLLFNAYEDVHKYFEIDSDLTIDCLAKNVEWAMTKSIEDIENDFSDNIKYLKSKAPKKGIIYKNKAAHTRENTYSLLDSYYNTEISVTDNIADLYNIYGYTIKKSTVYEYLKNRKITYTNNELILSSYDFNISLRKNWKYINENICKVSLGKLSKLINQ